MRSSLLILDLKDGKLFHHLSQLFLQITESCGKLPKKGID